MNDYTDRLRRACKEAREIATEMGHTYVSTEHMLLGLIKSKGVALNVLQSFGVTEEKCLGRIKELLGDLIKDNKNA